MGTEADANRAFARKWFEEVWQKHNMDAIEKMVAPGATIQNPASPQPLHGPEGAREAVQRIMQGFPDLSVRIEDIVADEHQVGVHFIASGTHEGEFMGVSPTGQTVTVHGTSFQRLEEGQVVEEWDLVDMLGVMRQVGVVEAPA